MKTTITSLARSSALRLLRTGSAFMITVGAVALAVASAIALAQGPTTPAPGNKAAAGKQAFVEVARVLQSPRCQNCHPAGDRPLQGDQGKPHAQNISRASIAAGLPCSTCHQDRNSEAIGVAGGPPGAPRWNLPPAEHPMVFQGKTPTALCEQLKDPKHNGAKTLAQLLEHVSHDPLVLWGWKPGGTRPTPPLPHDRFVAAFATWVASDGACP
jgi:mono/diheme cytochrome c family protein